MRTRLLLAALVTALASWPLHSQPATQTQSSTHVVSGRVTDAEGRPLRGVRIQVVAPPATFDAVYSDEAGVYASAAPSNTPFAIQVSKAGYVTRQLDATTIDPLIPIPLTRGSAINGRVVDRFGDPGVGLGVQVASLDGGSTTGSYATITDDRGEFRIGSLPAGRYAARLTRGVVYFDEKTSSLTIPLIESYDSTTMPQEFTVGEAQEVSVNLVHDAGNDAVQRGAIAAGDFERDQARSGRVLQTAKETGSIEGWVTDDRGRLARGIVVEISPLNPSAPADPLAQIGILSSPGMRRVATDADGRYVFTGVAPGRYAIYARRSEYGSSRPGPATHGSAQVIDVRGNDTVSVRLAVAGSSAIGGTVVDRYGDPVEGVAVQLYRVLFNQGRAVLELFRDVTIRVTDDRGRYRIASLPPGHYYVVAGRDGRETYYPGRASLAEAIGVQVEPGSDLLNTDVMLEETPRARVFGTVSGATYNPEVILAESARAGAAVARLRTARITGTDFEFRDVPPGDYVLQVSARGSDNLGGALIASVLYARVTAFATQPISVQGDTVGPIAITATSTGSVSGRIRLDAADGRTLPSVAIEVMPAEPDRVPASGLLAAIGGRDQPFASAESDRQGTFIVEGVAGAIRLMAQLADTRWWLKSAIIDGIDATVNPVVIGAGRSVSDVEVVLSGDAGTIEGRVTDARVAAFGATVLAFSTNSQRWFYRSQYVRATPAGRDGAFSIAGLPPGDYYVIAVDDLAADDPVRNVTNAGFLLDLIAGARRVSVPPSARASAELPLRSSR